MPHGDRLNLRPRTPLVHNDKTKNKRPQKTKSTTPALALEPKVHQDQFDKKKAAPPSKAYHSKAKKPEDAYLKFKHPSPIGLPIEPVTGEHEELKGTTK